MADCADELGLHLVNLVFFGDVSIDQECAPFFLLAVQRLRIQLNVSPIWSCNLEHIAVARQFFIPCDDRTYKLDQPIVIIRPLLQVGEEIIQLLVGSARFRFTTQHFTEGTVYLQGFAMQIHQLNAFLNRIKHILCHLSLLFGFLVHGKLVQREGDLLGQTRRCLNLQCGKGFGHPNGTPISLVVRLVT